MGVEGGADQVPAAPAQVHAHVCQVLRVARHVSGGRTDPDLDREHCILCSKKISFDGCLTSTAYCSTLFRVMSCSGWVAPSAVLSFEEGMRKQLHLMPKVGVGREEEGAAVARSGEGWLIGAVIIHCCR